MNDEKNVLGEPLQICGERPLTGFFRDGCCRTGPQDPGLHTICTRVSADFLAFSQKRGNDLLTPAAASGFPGLKPGDRWCLCAARWQEALGIYESSRSLLPEERQLLRAFDRSQRLLAGLTWIQRLILDGDVPGETQRVENRLEAILYGLRPLDQLLPG